jgi:hypothetical protein
LGGRSDLEMSTCFGLTLPGSCSFVGDGVASYTLVSCFSRDNGQSFLLTDSACLEPQLTCSWSLPSSDPIESNIILFPLGRWVAMVPCKP